MAKQVKMVITIDGADMDVDADGYSDGMCLKELDKLNEALGGKVAAQQKKPEALRTPAKVEIGKK